jgi:hypothetical protein
MNRLIVLIILFLSSASISLAQKEQNIWYFGYRGGFDFNSGVPVNLFTSQMITNAGSASIADRNGNFLFSSNGNTVWNSNINDTMPNGTGLLGSPLSTQSALIVPWPGHDSLYYLFTTDAIENIANPNGLRYNIVNKNLQGGLGDVTATKNVLLQSPMTEKLCAVQDSATRNIWIVSHKWNTNEFYAYHVDSTNGLNTTPVISAVGLVHSGGLDNQNAKGYMKISRDGSKLALAINEMDLIEIFDFNKTTGAVSNEIQFPTGTYTEVYGVEFSPDGSRLYVSTLAPVKLYQVNLLAGSSAAIIASSTLIANSTASGGLGGLQVAPDDKIYAARFNQTYMGAINNPNSLGTACNFVDLGPFMITGTCIFGMPNMLPRMYSPPLPLGIEQELNPLNFSVYPNPSSNGIFTLSGNITTGFSSIRINVFDILGHEVYLEDKGKLSGSFSEKINLHGLSAGIYQLILKQGGYTITRKILLTP